MKGAETAMATARIGDIDIHYDVADYTDPWRDSETILLHHGFARNLQFWREWVPLLARDYRVVRLDARGCGKTTVPPYGAPYTMELMMRDALGLMDHLGIERVHWGAEASGGHVGLAIAIAHPERIASLTLCNTPFQVPKSFMDNFVAEEVEKFGLGYWARKTLQNRIDVDKISPEWIEWSTAEFDKTPHHIAIAQHEMIAQGNIYPRLHEVRAPVLLMAGVKSSIAPKEQMTQMQQQLPQAKLVLFEGYGQGIAFMVPERCVAEMRTFLKSLPAATIR
jgi:3-oxoadipate enol-lactonase